MCVVLKVTVKRQMTDSLASVTLQDTTPPAPPPSENAGCGSMSLKDVNGRALTWAKRVLSRVLDKVHRAMV